MTEAIASRNIDQPSERNILDLNSYQDKKKMSEDHLTHSKGEKVIHSDGIPQRNVLTPRSRVPLGIKEQDYQKTTDFEVVLRGERDNLWEDNTSENETREVPKVSSQIPEHPSNSSSEVNWDTKSRPSQVDITNEDIMQVGRDYIQHINFQINSGNIVNVILNFLLALFILTGL